MGLRALRVVVAATLILGSSALVEGQASGVAGGYSEVAPPATTGRVGSLTNPARVSSGVMASLLVHKVDPVYPTDTNQRGAVVLMAIINTKGKVEKLSVISGPEMLRSAALDSVQQWTYKPYLLNGDAVYVRTTVTVDFSRQIE
jgi:periplasmic protein TonB